MGKLLKSHWWVGNLTKRFEKNKMPRRGGGGGWVWAYLELTKS